MAGRSVAGVLAAALAAAPAGPSRAEPASAAVTLHGLSGPVVQLTPADLARLPQVHVGVTHGGQTHDYAGPELAALLRQVDAPLGPRLHGAAVATVVRIVASDGYRVALSLGEVDPELHRGARVILADQVDGRPLPPGEAPARLVIEGDSRPARDARSVVSVDLQALP